jgi:polygalacturonase
MSGRSDRRGFLASAGVLPAYAAAAGARTAARPPPAHAFEVTQYGAVGDGKTSATDALQKAIDACGAAGGGTVLVPAGRYVTGALTLRSHVRLHLAPGATLMASTRTEDFPAICRMWPSPGRVSSMGRASRGGPPTG